MVGFVYFRCHHFVSFDLEFHFHCFCFLRASQLWEVLFEVPYQTSTQYFVKVMWDMMVPHLHCKLVYLLYYLDLVQVEQESEWV